MGYALEQLHGADNVFTSLNDPAGYLTGVTSVVVFDASAFPPVPFAAALGSGTARYEEVVVTAVAGTTFTLLAPTTQPHNHGEAVENTVGAEVLDRLADFATAHTHTGGLDGTALPHDHLQAHAIGGADHTGTLAHGSLSSVTADQHHAQAHAIGGADHSGQLAHTALTSVGTNTHAQIDTALATAVTNDATAAAHLAATAAHGAAAAVVGTTDTQTLTNKTLTTPTIADLTNAQHTHGNAAGGGALGATALPAVKGCRVTHNANQSLTTGVPFPLAFNTERWDTDAIHDTVTNNGRLTCKTAGKYLITAHIEFATNVTGYRAGFILFGGTTYIAGQQFAALAGGVSTVLSLATLYDLAVNDFVELYATQSSGGALNVTNTVNYGTEFGMVRVGA